jgi:hypothetical protein
MGDAPGEGTTKKRLTLLDELSAKCLPSKSGWRVLYVNTLLRASKAFRDCNCNGLRLNGKRFTCRQPRVKDCDEYWQVLACQCGFTLGVSLSSEKPHTPHVPAWRRAKDRSKCTCQGCGVRSGALRCAVTHNLDVNDRHFYDG